MRASSAIIDVQPEPAEEYVRERTYGPSELCSQCNRGHMHRAHRHSMVDFLVSLVGIFPTVCGYCHARSQRLEPRRPVVLLATATLALGSYIAHGLWPLKAAAAPVKGVNGQPRQPGSTVPARGVFDER